MSILMERGSFCSFLGIKNIAFFYGSSFDPTRAGWLGEVTGGPSPSILGQERTTSCQNLVNKYQTKKQLFFNVFRPLGLQASRQNCQKSAQRADQK